MTEAVFINLTPHPIRIRTLDGASIEVSPSGQVARVCTVEQPRGVALTTSGGPVQLVSRALSRHIHGLPNPDSLPEGAVLLVSSMVLEAARQSGHPLLDRMAVPDTGPTARRNSSGQVEYVTRLIVA